MGTTTFYLKNNDLGRNLHNMSKEELEQFDKINPYSKDPYFKGWKVAVELHNGNIYPLIFWKGRFMKLEDALANLNKKYYDKYTGKNRKEYEWTLLKNLLLSEIERLDEEFKASLRKKKK